MGYLLKTRLFLLCIFLFGLSGQISFAQNVDLYPEKSVRIIVPYPPGGFNDTMARIFSRKLQTALGQSFIVDNKPGAGTILGTDLGAKACLLYTSPSPRD